MELFYFAKGGLLFVQKLSGTAVLCPVSSQTTLWVAAPHILLCSVKFPFRTEKNFVACKKGKYRSLTYTFVLCHGQRLGFFLGYEMILYVSTRCLIYIDIPNPTNEDGYSFSIFSAEMVNHYVPAWTEEKLVTHRFQEKRYDSF